MDESLILKVSLIVSLIGLIALFFISSNIEEKDISKINNYDENKLIRINGEITAIKDFDKFQLITVAQPCTIDVLFFKETDSGLAVGQSVTGEGKLREYQGKMEMVADKVAVRVP